MLEAPAGNRGGFFSSPIYPRNEAAGLGVPQVQPARVATVEQLRDFPFGVGSTRAAQFRDAALVRARLERQRQCAQAVRKSGTGESRAMIRVDEDGSRRRERRVIRGRAIREQ